MEREADTSAGRIAICAVDASIRGRLEVLIRDSAHELVATTESIEELLEAVPLAEPSLVVLVHELEPFASIDEVASLRDQLGSTRLVVVPHGFIGTGPRRLLRAGVDGMVMEPDLEAALIATVDAVLLDHLCLPSSLREEIARPVFSHREKQIFELVIQGLTNGEIAAQLYLSESTVKSHLASSFRKLGVSSRAQAIQRVLDPESGLDLAAPATAPSVTGALG